MRHRDTTFCAARISTLTLLSLALAACCLTARAQSVPPSNDPSLTEIPPAILARLSRLQHDAASAHASHDAKKEAAILLQLGDLNLVIYELPKSLDSYQQALALARTLPDPHLQATALNGIASCYRTQNLYDKALETNRQALDLATASGDIHNQAVALNGEGWVEADENHTEEALKFENNALPLAQQLADPGLTASILNRFGGINDDLGNTQVALDYFQRALDQWTAAKDGDGQGRALNNMGLIYAEMGQTDKALNNYTRSLPLFREAGDRSLLAGAMNNIGLLYRHMGDEQKALEYFKQALSLQRALGNRRGEAAALNNLGNIYSAFGDNHGALDSFEQSYKIHHELNNVPGEAGALHNMGELYVHMDEMQKALEILQRALALWNTVENRKGAANTLNAIGIVYDDLGDQTQALHYYVEALTTYQNAQYKEGEATELSNIAGIFTAPNQKANALKYYQLALQLQREVHNRDGEARTLNNIGLVYEDLNQRQQAIDSLEQGLTIWREVGDRDGEAQALNNIGSFWDLSGDKEKARSYYLRALPIARAVNDPLYEAQIFHNLMLNLKTTQPTMAVFYGKQAVNLVQHVRSHMQGLEKSLQKSFLVSKNEYYHDLDALLIALGRLPEAQQVLDLMKEDEYSDYVRGETGKNLDPLSLTPAEQQARDDYEKSTAQIVSIGEQWLQLKRNKARTTDQDKEYQQLSDQIDAASKGLNDYFGRLFSTLGNNSETANRQVDTVKGSVSALRQIIARMPHTVALYTLTTKDRYSVIVITGSTEVAREHLISAVDLNRKIADFAQVLRDRHRDPKPLAQELYAILIGPIAADLEQAKAETLVWSLDGVLRYIPIAALYDGNKYMVEKYNNASITPASIPHLAEKTDTSNLNAAAMGISRKYEAGLPALPAVAAELDEIVDDPQNKNAHGPLPGTILLNGAFTEKAMEALLDHSYSVVHIASHFVFKPGDATDSYLLLAGKDTDSAGYHLTVASFRDNAKLTLENVDLLTLSACETGMGGSAGNGQEVDGLGTTAQIRGVKAVISSLWEVDDASTGELMSDFYRLWATGGDKIGKGAALRQAQLNLLSGKITPQSGAANRGVDLENRPAETPANYAHPYYWAPFVLMGNWQ
jgi:CHAT domain-containing protein/tetratricopeptide (TPR) repeat protein